MGYVLILVSLLATGEVDARHEGLYVQMSDCFHERETLLKQLKPKNAKDEITLQAVCLALPSG